jgi:hypothetical protein
MKIDRTWQLPFDERIPSAHGLRRHRRFFRGTTSVFSR